MALQEQRHESNAAAARQLKLIDRLRADKEALAAQGADLAHDLKVSRGTGNKVTHLIKEVWQVYK